MTARDTLTVEKTADPRPHGCGVDMMPAQRFGCHATGDVETVLVAASPVSQVRHGTATAAALVRPVLSQTRSRLPRKLALPSETCYIGRLRHRAGRNPPCQDRTQTTVAMKLSTAFATLLLSALPVTAAEPEGRCPPLRGGGRLDGPVAQPLVHPCDLSRSDHAGSASGLAAPQMVLRLATLCRPTPDPASMVPVSEEPPSLTAFLNNGVTAHRGNSDEYPENTIRAFESGIAVGADWIELDIYRTRDGKLVVIHDPTTARVGDKELSVPDSTFRELLTVDVATDFRRRTGQPRSDCPAATIPLLEEVLQLVMKQHRTRVSIQPKMDCVAEAMALIDSLGARRWVGFNDGNLQYMAQVKQLAPDVPVFWDRGADTDISQDIRTARLHGFEALVLHYSGVTAEKVQQVKAAGLEIGAWTVNGRATMTRLLELGVERLYTDQPRTLLALKSAADAGSVSDAGPQRQ